MSRSTSHPLFITALFALMVTACAAIPTPAEHARKTQYEKAKAVFDERCKTAGMKIYRTVEDVEGVFLVDAKPEDRNTLYRDWKDSNWAYAGLPQETGGGGTSPHSCIGKFAPIQMRAACSIIIGRPTRRT